MGDSTTEEIILRVRMDLNGLKQDQAKLQQMFKGSSSDLNNKQLAQNQQAISDKTKELNKLLDEGTKKFPSYALSIMFFGMAVQRTFQSIAQQGISTFNDVSHSIMFNVTETDRLAGSFKYLGFLIGDALQPIIAWLIPIVDSISEWVSNNETLVAGIVALGIALGTILSIGGMLKLAIAGFEGFDDAIDVSTTAITRITTALEIGLLPLIGIIVAAVIILYTMWQSNFGGMRDFINNTFGAIWNTIKKVFEDIWNIVKTVIDIIVAIFSGDWDKVAQLTWNLLLQLTKLFLDAMLGIGVVIYNVMMFAWNLVVDLVLKIVVGLVTEIQKLFLEGIIDLIKWIEQAIPPGILRAPFDAALTGLNALKNGITGLQTDATKLADSLHAVYLTGDQLNVGYDAVASALGLNNTLTQPTSLTNNTPTTTTNNGANPFVSPGNPGNVYNISIDKVETTNATDLMSQMSRLAGT